MLTPPLPFPFTHGNFSSRSAPARKGNEAFYKRGALSTLAHIIRAEGPLALYKGVGPRISRVCCEVAITMSLYGEVVKVLNTYWITADQLEGQTKK